MLETTKAFKTAERDALLLATTDAPEFFNWDTAKTGTSPQTAPLRADLAPQVARQLIEVMSQAIHRPIEITLSPQELGRVRMSILAEDGAITVNIIAERADTLELMRRNIDQLGQTFRSMGYEQISFAFGQGTHSGDQEGQSDTPNQEPDLFRITDETIPEAPSIIDLNASPERGVDIRL